MMRRPAALSLLACVLACGAPPRAASGPALPTQAAVAGRVCAAPVGGAHVAVFRLAADGSREAQVGTVTTDAGGAFALQVAAADDALLGLEASGGSYVEEATGAVAGLQGSMRLMVAASAASGVGITPLTELATQRALAKVGGAVTAVEAARDAAYAVSRACGLVDVTRMPADLTTDTPDPAGEGARQALLLAAISQLATSQGLLSQQLVLALVPGFVQSGTLDATGSGTAARATRSDGSVVTLGATVWSTELATAALTYLGSHGAAQGLSSASLTQLDATPPLAGAPGEVALAP